MEPNKPTRRVFGTDASLSWEEQKEQVRRANSKLVTKLCSMLDTVTDPGELSKISQALSQAGATVLKHTDQEQDQELSDEQLARAIKK